MSAVYLDHNATSPLAPEVRDLMVSLVDGAWGNPSSPHGFGRRARALLDRSREQVAAAVGAHPTEVVFTSGGSEADNLILKGLARQDPTLHLAVSAVEHPAIGESARQLERSGARLDLIGVDREGRIDRDDYARILDGSPDLVSVMAANNETGVIQDIAELAGGAHRAGALFHSDAVQALGRIELDFRASGVDAMSLSSHKIGGPLGAGALILSRRVELAPLVAGGGQEGGLRSGTENFPALAGFGLACELASVRRARMEQVTLMREHCELALRAAGALIFADGAERLPNTIFFAFAGVAGDALILRLDRHGFALASGSACSSAAPGPSATLIAMGVEAPLAVCAVRLSLGPENTMDEVARFLLALSRSLEELKGLAAPAA